MAAYGQHELILNATSLEGKRAAVNFLLFGDATIPRLRMRWISLTVPERGQPKRPV
jgi:hypothetical protein